MIEGSEWTRGAAEHQNQQKEAVASPLGGENCVEHWLHLSQRGTFLISIMANGAVVSMVKRVYIT